MHNVIKASEYVSVKNGSAFPSNNVNLQDSSYESSQGAQDQHRKIVNEAFQKAQQIMEAAQNYSMNKVKESTQQMNQEAAQVLVQSREDGYRRGLLEGEKDGRELGYKDGLKNAEEENQAVAAELSGMLETVETMKCEILRKYEEDIKKLAVAIAEKVIKRELSIDEKAMQSIITNAVDSYRNQEWIRILVSKNTKTLLQSVDKSIVQALSDVSDNIKIEVSPDMDDGDCTIEMPDQMIDAGVNTQIDKIKHVLDM
nr:FliH/SctL family protein [uncultured Caproiciproducens sp.]